jgi:hypothetical protein
VVTAGFNSVSSITAMAAPSPTTAGLRRACSPRAVRERGPMSENKLRTGFFLDEAAPGGATPSRPACRA